MVCGYFKNILKDLFILFYMNECFDYMYVCVSQAHGIQKKMLNPLEWEFPMIVSHHIDH